jgi:hypothetical protein
MSETMKLWGQTDSVADGFAMVFWAVSFVPVTAVGLAAFWRKGLSVASIRTRDASAQGKA